MNATDSTTDSAIPPLPDSARTGHCPDCGRPDEAECGCGHSEIDQGLKPTPWPCAIPDSAIPMTRDQAGDEWPSWDRGWTARETEAKHLPDPRRKDDSRRAYEAGWATRDIIGWGMEHDRVWPLADSGKRPRARTSVPNMEEWDAGFRERLTIRCPDDSQRLWDEAIERGEGDDLELRTDSEQSGWWTADREIYRRTLELWEACE